MDDSEQQPERCSTCRFWVMQPKDGDFKRYEERESLPGGVCHRSPPAETPEGTFHPSTYSFDWCGEHEPIPLPVVTSPGMRPKEVCGQCGQVIAEADDQAVSLCLRCYMEARRPNP